MAKDAQKAQTIGMLAATHAGFRAVFEDLGLDYYCAGNLTLDDAARGAGLDPDDVRSAMQRVVEKDPDPNWFDRPLRELIDRLDREHHQLLRSSVFQTAVLLDDALSRHGDTCAGALRHNFRVLSEELLEHIELEEVSLFPIAGSLDDAWSKGEPLLGDRDEVRYLVGQLTLAHSRIIQKLNAVTAALSGVANQADETCRKIVKNLVSIARHIHAYLNLESQVVFPQVIALLEEPPVKTAHPELVTHRWGLS